MSDKGQNAIRIDLDRFKLHLKLADRPEISLHFNTPSRRFYLSVIALVVNEMKKLGRITSIPLDVHWDMLALLNETVGAGAGSSKRENLLPRIYRKWKDALPDLENAPLFNVLGKKKEYGDGFGKTYLFAEEDKDAWANLFEYKGSYENVRLRFSVDKLGANLNDLHIMYGESKNLSDENAWNSFLYHINQIKVSESHHTIVSADGLAEETSGLPKQHGNWRRLTYWGFALLVLAVLAGFALFKFYFDTDIEPASVEKRAFPLPDKPSIAVLPFKNVSGDSEQEYFSDGMTDDLITDLSKISGLFVIARNSAFTYKGKPVKIEQVARELGVRYVLEGSVRRAKNQVRINAQLIDAKSGTHLWAERYDDKMDDIFALQDRITNKIVTALAVKLTPNEKDLISRKGTDCIEAYDAFLKGEGHFLRWTREDTRKAVPYLKEAIELDPNYGRAYATLGLLYWNAPQTWSGVQWPKGKLMARSCLNSAMKNPGPYAHRLAAWIKLRLRLYDEAISEAEQALALAPNDPAIHEVMANVLYCAGRPKEAVEYAKYFMRHDPRRLHLGLFHQGLFYFCMRKFEQAANYFERSITHSPEGLSVYLNLAVCYVHLGRKKEAREAINNYYKRLGWEPFLRALMYFYPFKDPKIDKLFADGLLEAGIKGEPSGYYKILEENRLDGEEIRQLLFGQKLRRWCPWIDHRDITRTEDGTIMCRSDEVGKSRIEGDMLCEKWNARFDGLEYCGTVFRNPEGFFDTKDEYLHVTDFEICWLSPYER